MRSASHPTICIGKTEMGEEVVYLSMFLKDTEADEDLTPKRDGMEIIWLELHLNKKKEFSLATSINRHTLM